MSILAIDPGPEYSAWVLFDTLHGGRLLRHGHHTNSVVLAMLERCDDALVIEMIASYGMPVGREVFDTCRWIGRFEQQWARHNGSPASLVFRKDVKIHLCGSVKAKDGNVRQALMDRFGGSKCKGTKKNPGPLYGVSGDVWAALAVAVTFAEKGRA